MAVLPTPALPWAAGTRGRLEFTQPITRQQWEDGGIVIVAVTTLRDGRYYTFVLRSRAVYEDGELVSASFHENDGEMDIPVSVDQIADTMTAVEFDAVAHNLGSIVYVGTGVPKAVITSAQYVDTDGNLHDMGPYDNPAEASSKYVGIKLTGSGLCYGENVYIWVGAPDDENQQIAFDEGSCNYYEVYVDWEGWWALNYNYYGVKVNGVPTYGVIIPYMFGSPALPWSESQGGKIMWRDQTSLENFQDGDYFLDVIYHDQQYRLLSTVQTDESGEVRFWGWMGDGFYVAASGTPSEILTEVVIPDSSVSGRRVIAVGRD